MVNSKSSIGQKKVEKQDRDLGTAPVSVNVDNLPIILSGICAVTQIIARAAENGLLDMEQIVDATYFISDIAGMARDLVSEVASDA